MSPGFPGSTWLSHPHEDSVGQDFLLPLHKDTLQSSHLLRRTLKIPKVLVESGWRTKLSFKPQRQSNPQTAGGAWGPARSSR